MSGPGAMVRSAEAARKRAMSGMGRATNKKAPYEYGALLPKRKEPSGLRRLYRHGALLRGTVGAVLHLAGGRGEERVVLADADVGTGVELRAALANEDGARVH